MFVVVVVRRSLSRVTDPRQLIILRDSRAAVSSKNGVSHNVDAGNLVGLSEISDYDVTIAKPCELLGQACDVELSMQKCKSVRD